MNEKAASPSRDDALRSIQRELTAFARRARSRAAELHPELSLVAFSMLDLMTERGGCRGADLAAYFMLDKSTVSRQVGALEKLGYLVRETDPEDHRGQILRPSPAGLEAMRAAHEQRRIAFLDRLTDWDDADIAQLAAYLERYNSSF
ncbi:MarR family winged helix-turn-helix transcriptional regulator [Saccharothrix sp. ST-888]|uniref:MarR family winged helix-turn-helix transcriptional regulator n=1 Tax=Saccharothrix sp. ST-888 TaxID=1427391 RepID=UPI00061FE3D5|nr:MarR family transcriptional regulator [Saccharothrix sp. ST-888]KJK59930.1 MarR family transcriptional regulator [Saccharothrix sp. ST-888]